MNNTGIPVETGLRNSPDELSWWTRFRFKRAVVLINRAFDRFPGLVSGITRLETAEALARKLERQLKESEKKKKELEVVLGQTLAAAETVLEEMTSLRGRFAGQFRQTSTMIERQRGELLGLLSVAEGTFQELGHIRADAGIFRERSLGTTSSALFMVSKLEGENDQLRAEMAALTAEVAESQSQTALEIDKLRNEISRLQGKDSPASNHELGPL